MLEFKVQALVASMVSRLPLPRRDNAKLTYYVCLVLPRT